MGNKDRVAAVEDLFEGSPRNRLAVARKGTALRPGQEISLIVRGSIGKHDSQDRDSVAEQANGYGRSAGAVLDKRGRTIIGVKEPDMVVGVGRGSIL
jgi:hypothetical protein